MKKLNITRHCLERFIQRRHGKFRHLENCKKPDCEICQNYKNQINDYINKNRKLINYQICDAINNGTEEKSFKNNTDWLVEYYDRHGVDHNVVFIHNEDLIFICVPEKNEVFSVRTCVDAKGHVTRGVTMRPKFKKKQKA